MADANLVPDPNRIVARFRGEFDKLMWVTLMSPWEEEQPEAPAPPVSAAKPRKRRKPRARPAPAAAKIPKHLRGR
jgi:hypothetical protein